jgi:hypothetical protein
MTGRSHTAAGTKIYYSPQQMRLIFLLPVDETAITTSTFFPQ